MLRPMLMLSAAGLTLAACTLAPPEPRTPQQQARLDAELQGLVPGPPQNCYPAYRRGDQVNVDDRTLLMREGKNRVWRSDLIGECSGLSSGHYALVTESFGGQGLCRGDIAKVADLQTGFLVGSCGIGEWVPYTRPRG